MQATILWSGCAAAALMLAFVCGFVWLADRKNLLWLVLFILGISASAETYFELGMMHSSSPSEFGEWLRWYHVPSDSGFVAQVIFVHLFLGASNLWLLRLFVLVRSVVLFANFIFTPNFNFREIVSLRYISFLGEKVAVLGVAVPRTEWQWLATASLVILMAYFVDAVTRQWLSASKDSRRKARIVTYGFILPMFCVIVYTQVLVFTVWQVPITDMPWFIGTLVITAYALGRDVISNRRTQLEAAGLRAKLAQVERVGLMGQLASALSHELSQPLAATLLNADAAETYLKAGNANPEALRSILDDIRHDHVRAATIVNRMRRLFKAREIELQAIGLEDVLHDVVTLVRSEMTSKSVALRLAIQPGLPRVLGDPVHLTQVLLNLLMNSTQATQSLPQDARHVVVEAHRDGVEREVEIVVQDSGPGIPAGVADQLFTTFFTTKAEGTGIGLALSRTIIEAHGGRIWYDKTATSGGAVFRFTLRQAPNSENDNNLYPASTREGPPPDGIGCGGHGGKEVRT